ncbi:MAG: 16S rRNA (cytosine(1402)-N(4))-methyltransferase RsmH [Clostridiales bacterium]|jgi:16S rRNA (cytosine1402-N4)-methyltransferase|nr:16S rRNA (cytosine(1402)-N(4))-methyltransferase RsmH [Clostridiales bacterium]
MEHIPVLLNECIEKLNINPEGIYVDATLGGASHAALICEKLNTGMFIGIDKDEEAIERAKAKLSGYPVKKVLMHDSFSNIEQILENLEIKKIDGILMDLGVSSFQLDTPERGFSYMNDGPLDMRMDIGERKTAADIVNTYSLDALAKVIYAYGEEKWAKRIAEFIVAERERKDILTTFELVQIIKNAVPKGARENGPHPAKRTFQALRIELNNELNIIEGAINGAVKFLAKGGRVCVITFHSLEDRLVKETFKSLAQGCVCPRDFPVCICQRQSVLSIVTKKPVLPTEEEVLANPRARSAKLRVAEKL